MADEAAGDAAAEGPAEAAGETSTDARPPSMPPSAPSRWAYPAVPGYEALPAVGTASPGYPSSPGSPPWWEPAPEDAPRHPGFGTYGGASTVPPPAKGSAAPRPRRRTIVIVVVAVVLVGLGAGGVTALVSGSGSSSTATASPGVARQVQSSLAAARRVGSFHYVSDSTSQGVTQHTVGDAGPNSGRQVITIGPHTFTVLVIGSACYFQGDAVALNTQLGLSPSASTAHAGQWISLAPRDTPYASVYAAVTASSALSDNIAFRPRLDLGTSTVGGRRVRSIGGAMTNLTINGQTQHARGNAQLAVADTAPHLPVRYAERGTIDRQASNFVMTFSAWGRPVVVTAPAGAIAFSSLGPGATNGPPGSPTLV